MLLDFITLAVILGAGVDLGLLGATGYEPIGQLLGSHVRIACIVVGASALWQLLRQKLF